MQYDGEAGQLLHDGVQYIECQWGRNEPTGLRVACALFGRELIGAVAGTDGDSQAVATRAGSKVNNLFGLGVVAYGRRYLVFNACQHAELSLNGYIVLMSILNDFLGEGNVLLVGQRRSIDHHARETEVHAALAQLEAITVVQV